MVLEAASGASASAVRGGFDSSDEDDQEVDTTPLAIDWLDLSKYDFSEQLAISGLPGRRFKDSWRSLPADIATLKSYNIEDVFVLCTRGELTKYRVPHLVPQLTESGISVHHYPFMDGQTPTTAKLAEMIDTLIDSLKRERKCLIHCFGGLGRSCVVAACLLLKLDPSLESEAAIDKLRQMRGPGAVQSVKQYNFIHEYRENVEPIVKDKDNSSRSVSR